MLGELNADEISSLLKRNVIGRIGCTDGADVFIMPINYRYEQDSILCYSLEGHKIKLMRKNNSVCFEVDEIASSNDWKCVIVNGIYEEITSEVELKELRPNYTEYMLRRKVSLTSLPAEHSDMPSQFENLSAQVFFRIRFRKLSGRFENPDSYERN